MLRNARNFDNNMKNDIIQFYIHILLIRPLREKDIFM